MRFFQRDELRLLWPFYLDSILSPMLFFAPAFFVVYFAGLGLSAFEISLLWMMSPLFSLIFEIPTGAFADVYGRKASVLMSYFLASVSLAFISFFTNFYLLLVIFALIGVAQTFESGAREAWIVDLVRNKSKSIFQNYLAKAQALAAFALVISGFIGVLFVKFFGLNIIWIIGALAYAISFLIILLAKESRSRTDVHSMHSFSEIGKQALISLEYCQKNRVLFNIFLAGIIGTFATTFNSMLSWTPFLQGVGLSVPSFGYIWSAIAGASLLAAVLSYTILHPGKERSFIIISMVLNALIISLVAVTISPLFAVFILVSGILFEDMKRPALRTYFHKFVPSKMRATIGSIESMIFSIAGIIAMPITGLLIDNIGARYTIFLGGLLMLPSALMYYLMKERK